LAGRLVLCPAALQQVQELQHERRQLQKKLAGYRQQLVDTKAVSDQQQQQLLALQQGSTPAHMAALGVPAAQAAAAEQLAAAKLLHQQSQAELAAMRQQLMDAHADAASSAKQLQWTEREAQHLQQLLHQQQEISSQLRAEVSRLQQPTAAGSDLQPAAEGCRSDPGQLGCLAC